jgi:hypothetical protein
MNLDASASCDYGRNTVVHMELYDFFDPTPEQQNVVLICIPTLSEASG